MTQGVDFLVAVCSRSLVGELRRVDADYFFGEEETQLYDFVTNHVRQFGDVPSTDTLIDRMEFEIPDVDDSMEYYAEALNDRRLHNDVLEPFTALRTSLNERNTTELVSAVDTLASVTRQRRSQLDLMSGAEVTDLARTAYERNHAIDGLVGVPTGYATLDEDSGGMQGGDLNIMVARPGIGKTWLMLYMMREAITMHYNVLLATMEMSMQQIATRYFSMVANVNPQHARRGRLGTYDERRMRDVWDEYMARRNFYIYQGNMGQGMAGLDAVVAERRPDIVYVDGVYLMRSPRTPRNAGKNIIVSDVLDDLKEMALRRNIPFYGTSQLNREGAGENVSLETIGFTDAFSTHCSIIYALQKPHRRAPDTATRLLRTIKGREGEDATIAIDYKFNPIRFGEVPIAQASRRGDVGDVEENDMDWMIDDSNN